MTARYYLAPLPSHGVCELDGPEAHHLLHVMRAAVGDEVELFDGLGHVATARIVSAQRRVVQLKIDAVRTAPRESPHSLCLGVSLPKGDRQKWLVEKCVELGVSQLTPLAVERAVARPTAKALERLRRGVIEACKQCGRNYLMQILEPQSLSDWLEHRVGEQNGLADQGSGACWLAHPGDQSQPVGARMAQWAATWEPSSDGVQGAQSLSVAIGPEGGFSDAEVEQAFTRGCQLVNLGPHILRIETAAIAVAAVCQLNHR